MRRKRFWQASSRCALVSHGDASRKIIAMPWRIWGNVIAGVHFFPPLGFLDQKPRCQERKRLMMLPARPIAHLIVGQARFALASLNTFFDAMFSFGHPGQLRKLGLRDRVGQIIDIIGFNQS